MRIYEKIEVPTLADRRPFPWVRGPELVIDRGRLVERSTVDKSCVEDAEILWRVSPQGTESVDDHGPRRTGTRRRLITVVTSSWRRRRRP